MMEKAARNPVDRLMEKAVDDQVFPGGVLFCARDNEVLYHKAFGRVDLVSGVPMPANAIFDLASLTKPLAVALLACVLIQEKKVDFSTKTGQILSEFSSSPLADVSLDMLLRHTSGLPAHEKFFLEMSDDNRWQGLTPRQRLKRLVAEQALETPPGSHQLYSDIGYMVLGWMLEKIVGQRLDKAVQEKIYEPLGIRNLFFIDMNETNAAGSFLFAPNQDCPWRKKIMTGEVDDENAWASGGIEGHAGLFGDAMSVYLLCREILSAVTGEKTRLIDPSILGKFVEKYPGQQMVAGFDTPSPSASSAGSHVSSRAIGHLGFTGTSFWIDPDAHLVVVLLTNRTHPHRSNEKIRQFRPVIHDCVFSHFS